MSRRSVEREHREVTAGSDGQQHAAAIDDAAFDGRLHVVTRGTVIDGQGAVKNNSVPGIIGPRRTCLTSLMSMVSFVTGLPVDWECESGMPGHGAGRVSLGRRGRLVGRSRSFL